MLNNRPPPSLDTWIIIASYVRKFPFQVALVLVPFFLVLLMAIRTSGRR
ncbi:putative integral membrane protein [Theileria parva strain Muguga]|uniref:Uncharacterized protein n=1 Tax=Theileria parva TaxID=5875 RepID=Q4N9N5_THEPA|nr:putative integral membrane protein [Theileria parva strain Muguga]EAN33323.1 putative integral membrane protein [Theileria parva strain Muguga]|eukprot:XP_765606.1 hypothetical protein [Theileria parva strain Muguga]